MENEYRFRFFFDPGSGTCLWAGDDRTQEMFGYAVDLGLPPISNELRRRLEVLVTRYDESMDWADPGGAVRWDAGQCERFNGETSEVLRSLKEELDGFGVIKDEFGEVTPTV